MKRFGQTIVVYGFAALLAICWAYLIFMLVRGEPRG